MTPSKQPLKQRSKRPYAATSSGLFNSFSLITGIVFIAWSPAEILIWGVTKQPAHLLFLVLGLVAVAVSLLNFYRDRKSKP